MYQSECKDINFVLYTPKKHNSIFDSFVFVLSPLS